MRSHFSKVFILTVLLFLSWILWIEPDSITLNKKTVELSNWHKEHNGLKIAVISDLHISWPYINENKIKKIIELTNAQHPDLIVILGDYTPASVTNIFFSENHLKKNTVKGIKQLSKLKSDFGRPISILGNHDWGIYEDTIRKTLEKNGIKVLENESLKLSYKKKSFWIAGIADLWQRNPDIPATLNKIKDNNPIILLSHNPDVFPDVPKRIELTLAGHTHGGQLNIPVIRAELVPSSFGERYIKGLIKENNHYLFVSSGIGTTGLPLRFLDPPEITILEIKKLKTHI